MTKEKTRRSEWLRRGAEGLTIIVSILLALAADTAWSYRRDRVEERQLLEGLRTEFAGAAAEVASDLVARAEILRQVETLLQARHDPALAPTPESVPEIVTALIDWRFYTPAHAILDDAMSSGRLDLIRSDEVRMALMSYVQERGRVPVFDELERDFVASRLEPYLASRMALDRLLGASSPPGAVRAESGRVLSLLADDTFGSLLEIRMERTQQASIFARIVREAVADVRNSIDGVLGGGG